MQFDDTPRRRALFFDVDGTLMGPGGYVPESAKRALSMARKRGDLVFINSGRIYQLAKYINHYVQSDGLLCGCGTDLYLGDINLYRHELEPETVQAVIETCSRYDADLVIEGRLGVAVAPWNRIEQTMKITALVRQQDALWDGRLDDPGFEPSKFCIQYDERTDVSSFLSFAENEFDVIDRGRNFYECVPKGHGKAFAIKKITELLHIDPEDVYAFGDSTNDLDMLCVARHAIIMGKHDAELEPYAEFITRDLEDDGIEYAMKHYGLIG